MIHARLQRQLSAYADNELHPDERREVEAHLQTCTACREELAGLRQVKYAIGRLPEREVPQEVWQGLRRRIAEEESRSGVAGVFESLRAAFRRPVYAAAAAMLVLILIAVPLVKGRIDRLQAGGIGVDVYVREHALVSSADPFVDRAYIGLLIGDANLALAGARRMPGTEP
ncbi:MAG: anti-sigma factor family protein [bacterium]